MYSTVYFDLGAYHAYVRGYNCGVMAYAWRLDPSRMDLEENDDYQLGFYDAMAGNMPAIFQGNKEN